MKSHLVLGATQSCKGTAWARAITSSGGKLFDEAQAARTRIILQKNRRDGVFVFPEDHVEKTKSFLEKKNNRHDGPTVMHEVFGEAFLKEMAEIAPLHSAVDFVIRRPIDIIFSLLKRDKNDLVSFDDVKNGRLTDEQKRKWSPAIQKVLSHEIARKYDKLKEITQVVPDEKMRVVDTTYITDEMLDEKDGIHEDHGYILSDTRKASEDIDHQLFYVEDNNACYSVKAENIDSLKDNPSETARFIHRAKSRTSKTNGMQVDTSDQITSKEEEMQNFHKALEVLDHTDDGQSFGIIEALNQANQHYLKLRTTAHEKGKLRTAVQYSANGEEYDKSIASDTLH